MSFNRDEFFGEYNSLISRVMDEFDGRFAALASPLLSKQETVSGLYQIILAERSGNVVPGFPWKEIFQFLPRLFLILFRLCYASFFFRVADLPRGAVCFSSWLEPGCVKGSSLIDEHFRNIPEDLAEKMPVIVLQQSYDLSLLKRVRSLDKPKNYFVAEGLMSIFDILAVTFDYLTSARLRLKREYFLGGKNISSSLKRSLLVEFLTFAPFLAYQKKVISRRLLSYKPRAFIYVFENQSWEKVCCKVLRPASVTLIGVQGSGFSPFFLNFFPTEIDARKQPMPDAIFTVGDLFSRYLQTFGNYKIPIQTFAAARFPYPVVDSKFLVAMPNTNYISRVLYAFSVHIDQYQAILSDLIRAFEGSGIEVDLKLHPQFRTETIAGFNRLPHGFKVVSSIHMDQLSATYDCIIFNDNSFGIEAIISGVKSYQYDREGAFIDERLFYFDLWDAQIDFAGLNELRSQIATRKFDKGFDVTAARGYINSMYRPYEGDLGLLLNVVGANDH